MRLHPLPLVVCMLLAIAPGCADRASDGMDEGADTAASSACDPGCVEGELCCEVDECSECPAGFACLAGATDNGISLGCAPISATCDGTPTCACMGDEVCGELMVCSDAPFEGSDLACSCPACAVPRSGD